LWPKYLLTFWKEMMGWRGICLLVGNG